MKKAKKEEDHKEQKCKSCTEITLGIFLLFFSLIAQNKRSELFILSFLTKTHLNFLKGI